MGAATAVAVAASAHAADVATPAAPAEIPKWWTATFASDVRYFSWESTRGFPTRDSTSPGHGSEVYIPFAARIAGKPVNDFSIDLIARGGWVRASQSSGELSGSVDTTTDTVASGSITYLGFTGVQPFLALSLNLPTGKSSLFGPAANARMDPDLVEVASFGEGFNVGPTVGVRIPVNANLVLTTSAGYTMRNAYDRENSISALDPNTQTPTRVEPGDVFTWTGSIAAQIGQLTTTLTGTISEETATFENGVPLYRPGLRFLVAGSWAYAWPDQWGVTTLTASASHSNRNDVLFLGATALFKEAMNTNSNLFRVGIEHLVPVGHQVAIGPIGTFLFRDHNAYEPTTFQFVPEKQRYSAGALARWAANPTLTFNARVEHVWTHEGANPAPDNQQFSILANSFVAATDVPQVSSTGWQVTAGFNQSF